MIAAAVRLLAVAALCLALCEAAHAQAGTSPRGQASGGVPVMLVVDISGSMGDDGGNGAPKIDGAKLALLDYLDTVEEGAPIGLRTYPDQGGDECNDGRLRIETGPADPEAMSAVIRKLQPEGSTPTAEAMRAAVADLRDQGYGSGTLVLVSDGESKCDDPCEAAREIADQGFDLDTITVGFRISKPGREELQCISDALDGRYLDIEDNDELRKELERLGQPQLEVRLDGPAKPRAVAGGDPVEISATVVNNGDVEARDVIAHLAFARSGVDVRRPVTRLGNLAARSSRSVVWRVRAGAADANELIPFTVVGRALNAAVSAQAAGALQAVAVKEASDAGEILKGPGDTIAILGDSYSAGEGADRYEPGTDTPSNGCHRSPLTYLVPAFGEDKTDVLACSGAVTADVYSANVANPQDGVLDDLQDKGREVRAAVMTIGGNDAEFANLAKSCVLVPISCTGTVFTGLPANPIQWKSRADFNRDTIGPNGGLPGALAATYEWVNRALNDPEAVKRRDGAMAPILVLGYPLPVPLAGRSCLKMGFTARTEMTLLGPRVRTDPWLDPAEIDSIVDFALELNATIEEAVLNLRRTQGVPIFYVPTTERAFLPRHTLCDIGFGDSPTAPFARSLTSLNGAGVPKDLKSFLDARSIPPRSLQELAHPNAKGYAAETLAILRWSRSPAASDAATFLRTARPPEPVRTSWSASELDLGVSDAGRLLQGGTSYGLTLQGFAPDSQVRVIARSTPRLLAHPVTDSRGRISTRVGIPRDLPGGRHTLEVSGVDPRGRPRVVRLPFEIEAPFRPPVLGAMAAGSGAALILGLLLAALTGELARWGRRLRGRAR